MLVDDLRDVLKVFRIKDGCEISCWLTWAVSPLPAEALSPSPTSHGLRRSSEGRNLQIPKEPPPLLLLPASPPPLLSPLAAPPAASLVEDIGEMILQLRRQVENLFSVKFGTSALGFHQLLDYRRSG